MLLFHPFQISHFRKWILSRNHFSTTVTKHPTTSNSNPDYRNSKDIMSTYFETTPSSLSTLPLCETDFLIFPNFISDDQEAALLKAAEFKLRRLRYENNHFDKVITGYRESSATYWGRHESAVLPIIQKVHSLFQVRWLPVHVLDLAPNGEIEAHVDNLEYSGGLVGGLCLKSIVVMELKPSDQHLHEKNFSPDPVKVLLPPKALYFQRGLIRNHFNHAIYRQRGDQKVVFKGQEVEDQQRLVFLFRDEKSKSVDSNLEYTRNLSH